MGTAISKQIFKYKRKNSIAKLCCNNRTAPWGTPSLWSIPQGDSLMGFLCLILTKNLTILSASQFCSVGNLSANIA